MFESIIHILYFSPSIINQLQVENSDGLIISKSNVNKKDLKTSIKVLINKMFIPLGAEASSEYETSYETQIDKKYDDLYRALQTVRQAQSECLIFEHQIEEGYLPPIFLVEGTIKVIAKKSVIDNSMLICTECCLGDYTIKGMTSIDNWTSKSFVNHILMIGEVSASMIILPFSVNGKIIDVKVACIFIL